MQSRVTIAGIMLLLIAGAAIFGYRVFDSSRNRRDKLVAEFMQVLPPELKDYHIEEISELFDHFWYRADHDRIAPEDVDVIMGDLHKYVDRGSITIKELDYVMAEVGYFTYRSDDRFKSEDGAVDHPVLNPSAGAAMSLDQDSTFWEGFEEFKKEREAAADSLRSE